MNALKVGKLFRVTNGIIVLIVSTSENVRVLHKLA